MDPLTAVGIMAVGLAAGVLSGMFGVGGAVISTPGIRSFGVSPIDSVGSTIPAILPAAITGAHRYARAGLVNWRVGLTCGLTGAALAVAGAKVADGVDARWLMVLTAAILGWSGVAAIRKARAVDRQRTPVSAGTGLPGEPDEILAGDIEVPAVPALMGVGAAAGFVAGLLGVGGGVIMMPLFTGVLRLPVKVAVASSLVAVAIFSVPAMIAHSLLGNIDWTVALLLVVGTVPGARIGAHITIGSSENRMRMLMGIFFIVVAVIYSGRELASIY